MKGWRREGEKKRYRKGVGREWGGRRERERERERRERRRKEIYRKEGEEEGGSRTVGGLLTHQSQSPEAPQRHPGPPLHWLFGRL